MRKALEIGGIVAAAILVAFGIAAIVMGFGGRGTVQDSLKQEKIVGSSDMTPTLIAKEAKDAGLTNVSLPTMDVAGKAIDTGPKARAFAGYMRIHALEATGGLTYAEMGRYLALTTAPKKFTDGHGGTNDAKYAQLDTKTNQPLANGARDVWVTETALSTALNASYMADQLSLFGIVVGVALLLAGIVFGVLAVGGALRNPDTVLAFIQKRAKGPARMAPIA